MKERRINLAKRKPTEIFNKPGLKFITGEEPCSSKLADQALHAGKAERLRVGLRASRGDEATVVIRHN